MNNDNDNDTAPVVGDEDEKKRTKREDARLRKRKSRENQKQKGITFYDAKNNLPMRQKRAEMKSNDPEKHAAKLADRRDKSRKRSDLSQEERQIERDKEKKRYNEKSPEEKEKRNKQKRELEHKKVLALKEVLQLSNEDAETYLPSITNCIIEGFKTTLAFQEKADDTINLACGDITRACNRAKQPGDFDLHGNTRKTLVPLKDFEDINNPPKWRIHITNEDTELSAALEQCHYNVFIKLHNPVNNPKVVAAMITCPAILLKKQENSSQRRGTPYIKYRLTGLKVEYVDMLTKLPKPQTKKKGYGIELMEKSGEILNADYMFLLSNEEARKYYINKLGFQPVGNDIKIKIPATYMAEEGIKHSFLYKKLKDDCQDLCDDYIMLFDKSMIIG